MGLHTYAAVMIVLGTVWVAIGLVIMLALRLSR
jgi:hypothetical protein